MPDLFIQLTRDLKFLCRHIMQKTQKKTVVKGSGCKINSNRSVVVVAALKMKVFQVRGHLCAVLDQSVLCTAPLRDSLPT